MRKPLRVLFVGDTEEGPELIARELARGDFEVEISRVTDAASLEARLTPPARWDAVLAEETSRVGSYKALALVRRTSEDTPFIVVRKDGGGRTYIDAVPSATEPGKSRLVHAIERALHEASLRAERQELREQLVIAERLASVGFLVAGVAHEINNPLASVIANLEFVRGELIRHTQAGNNVTDAMAALRDASEGAAVIRQVVRDLRSFSQKDPSDSQISIDVRPVLDSAIRMTWHEVRFRARLTRDFHETPRVSANEARLSQVFLNLLINAAHAIPQGNFNGNEIRVVARTDDRGSCVVEVHDTGSGIAPENLPHVFDAYFTTKAPGHGTGLGLAVSQRIVQRLGGEILVESDVGRGTCFRVVLPAMTGDGEDGLGEDPRP